MKSLQEWASLQQRITFRNQAYINGKFVPSQTGETFASINPATEGVLTRISCCDEKDVNLAVKNSKETFHSGIWSELKPSDRKKILLKLANLLEKNQDEFALLDTLDMGKSISEMTSIDLPGTIECFRWTAECIDKVYGEIAPTGPDTLALITREPAGVVAAITPWNYPLMMASWKLAPALAAGNSVILKPSEKASLSALRFAELATEAGIPDGVLNVIPGFGHTAGKALALHPDVDVIAFTGSTRVAGMLMEYAGQSNMKRVFLEAGGKSPNLIFDDCADLTQAAATAAAAIFSNQGEVCIACSRIYVQSTIKEPFLKALIEASRYYQPSNPLNPQTTMGPLVDESQFMTVSSYIESAINEGGRCILGGIPTRTPGSGYYVQPTIIDGANNEMKFVQEEIFGPVLAVCEFETEADAIQMANNNIYGLGASIWTSNLSRAHRVSKKLEAGMIWVNTWAEGDNTVPFGGIKASGNGRDKSLHSLDKYTDLKMTWIKL